MDVSGLSPVQAFAKVSALAMLTTTRVGNEEDPSMAQARPRLSEINKRGFVTTDSQMGKREVLQHRITGEDYDYRQRSYVKGLLPKHLGEEFKRRMQLEDGVMIFMEEPGPEPPGWEYRIPVTLDGDVFFTNIRMATSDFAYQTLCVLPEVQSIMSDKTCYDLVERDALLVKVVDTVWGRPFWLFDKIVEVLDEV